MKKLVFLVTVVAFFVSCSLFSSCKLNSRDSNENKVVVTQIDYGNDKGEEQTKVSEEGITLIVDYSRTVEQMIAGGNYDWSHEYINAKNFPISPEIIGKRVEVFAKLSYYDKEISSKDAISEINKTGFRPATLAELLALGEAYPELQKEFPVVALGSVSPYTNGYHRVPCLHVDYDGRGLYPGWFDGYWGAHCRFLAVRN